MAEYYTKQDVERILMGMAKKISGILKNHYEFDKKLEARVKALEDAQAVPIHLDNAKKLFKPSTEGGE